MRTIPVSADLHVRGSAGFALLEALVAMLIFAIGTLGVVGLQAKMTKAQTASKFRADAANLAQHLIGTMWADQPNLSKYATAQCASHPRCDEWSARIASQLPAGTSTVTFNATTGLVTISIRWTAPDEGTHEYRTATAING